MPASKASFFEKLFHDRVKATGADILGLLVHLEGNLGEAADTLRRKLQHHAVRCQQGFVLAGQAGVGLRQDALEILDRQGIQLDADRETPLQFGNQVGRARQVEGAAGNEQDVVGLHHAVLGADRRSFDERQQVALDALTRHVGAVTVGAGGDLVDLVEEDDAVLLDHPQRLGFHLLVVHQLGGLLVGKQLHRFADLELAGFLLPATDVLEHALELAGKLFHARRREDFGAHPGHSHLDLDFLVVQLTFAQLLAEFLAGGVVFGRCVGAEPHRRPGRRQQNVEDTVLGGIHRAVAHFPGGLLAVRFDGDFDEIANDRVHIASNIAHLGELGGLDLDEGRVGQTGQTTGDLGLADAGRADHQDVLGGDFALQRLGHLGAPPAVAQCDRNGLLGLALTDDMFVEFRDDLGRRHLGHWGPLPARREHSPLRRLCGLMA